MNIKKNEIDDIHFGKVENWPRKKWSVSWKQKKEKKLTLNETEHEFKNNFVHDENVYHIIFLMIFQAYWFELS